METKIVQKIEVGYGVNFWKLREDIQRITDEKNKEGYELTDVDSHTNNADTTQSSLAILVYTKK